VEAGYIVTSDDYIRLSGFGYYKQTCLPFVHRSMTLLSLFLFFIFLQKLLFVFLLLLFLVTLLRFFQFLLPYGFAFLFRPENRFSTPLHRNRHVDRTHSNVLIAHIATCRSHTQQRVDYTHSNI